MRAQMELLEYLVNAWDVQAQSFRLGAHMLSIQVEDIYFLTGLSRRGAPISLSSSRRVERLSRTILLHIIDLEPSQKNGKIKIKDVVHLPLKKILFIITR